MRSRLLAASAVALVLSGVAGCGDDGDTDTPAAKTTPAAQTTPAKPAAGSDAAQVTKVLNDYNAAYATGDYEGVCGLMSADARRQFLAAAAKQGVRDDCAGALGTALVDLSKEQLEATRAALRNAKVRDVKINGDKATAELTITANGRSQTSRFPVAKENGQWKVEQDLATGG